MDLLTESDVSRECVTLQTAIQRELQTTTQVDNWARHRTRTARCDNVTLCVSIYVQPRPNGVHPH